MSAGSANGKSRTVERGVVVTDGGVAWQRAGPIGFDFVYLAWHRQYLPLPVGRVWVDRMTIYVQIPDGAEH